jgi:hypothetical protein
MFIQFQLSDKVLLDMDQMASPHLLVTGATDRTVCFWDMRQGAFMPKCRIT